MATMILGGNTITNCSHAIVVAGREVFRLRNRGGDGNLVIDIECCDDAGAAVARVQKNEIVRASPGTSVRHGPGFAEVVDARGTVIARAEEVSPDSVRVVGRFGSVGMVLKVETDVLRLPRGGTMTGCALSGACAAIEIDQSGAFSIGKPHQIPRPGFRHNLAVPQLRQQGKRRR